MEHVRAFACVSQTAPPLARSASDARPVAFVPYFYVAFSGSAVDESNGASCLGHRRGSTIASTFADHTAPEIHPDDIVAVDELRRRFRAGGEGDSCQRRYRVKDAAGGWTRVVCIEVIVSLADNGAQRSFAGVVLPDTVFASHLIPSGLPPSGDSRSREGAELDDEKTSETVRRKSRIVGRSACIERSIALLDQVAPTSATVLLYGETGTGKELFAKAIHDRSPRADRAMVTLNCAGLPSMLMESELFGRERGAYTGAVTSQSGRFELAHQSTLFLDEVGELPLELQPKLLRMLQEGCFERVGSPKTHQCDVRIIAATNRDLSAMVREGRFREDLFYRLNVFPIQVPALRERAGDIPLLIWSFIDELSASMGRRIEDFLEADMQALQRYRWPGNVRELHNIVERAMIVCAGPVLRIPAPADANHPSVAVRSPTSARLEDVEREHILQTLSSVGWRIRGARGAAELLGLPPTTLESRMEKLKIRRPQTR